MSAAKNTPKVIALMGSEHYGHGSDQREAMSIVQEMLDACQAAMNGQKDWAKLIHAAVAKATGNDPLDDAIDAAGGRFTL